MQGITVLYAKKGGDTSVSSHFEWLPTVSSMPDAIEFSFIPITSLLKDVPGKGFLSHAINLYLRCKSFRCCLSYCNAIISTKVELTCYYRVFANIISTGDGDLYDC